MENPQYRDDDAQTSWMFKEVEQGIEVSVSFKGTIPIEFAKVILGHAVDLKDKAVIYGDGISLDMILGGLPKEAINDFGRAINLISQE